jgi:hypothetical protein
MFKAKFEATCDEIFLRRGGLQVGIANVSSSDTKAIKAEQRKSGQCKQILKILHQQHRWNSQHQALDDHPAPILPYVHQK